MTLHYRESTDYEALPGVNMSTLLAMRTSPKHYRHRLQHPKAQTDPMRLGTHAHIAVLEPDRFLREFVLWDSTDPETGKTRQRRGKVWDKFRAENAGKTVIRTSEYEAAIAISKAIRQDPVAMRYLAVGRAEVGITWTDERTGIGCKGRVDWVTDIGGTPFLVDLKTASTVTQWGFSRTATRLDYHLRAAFYADGYARATGREPGFAIVAAESSPPHDTVVYIVPGDVLDIGRDGCGELLDQLRECLDRDEWPGIGGGMEQTLQLPPWAVPDDDADAGDLGLVAG